MYYVYILKCEGELLYTGITTDIERRLEEHFGRTEKCAKFTRSHKALSLAALWSCADRSLASKLEYRIKQLSKPQKLAVIGDNSYLSRISSLDSPELYKRETI